jgi:hypothetical protein
MAYGLHEQTIEDSIDTVHEIYFKIVNIRLISKSSSSGSQICKQKFICICFVKVVLVFQLVVHLEKRIFSYGWAHVRTPRMTIHMPCNGCDIILAPFHMHQSIFARNSSSASSIVNSVQGI